MATSPASVTRRRFIEFHPMTTLKYSVVFTPLLSGSFTLFFSVAVAVVVVVVVDDVDAVVSLLLLLSVFLASFLSFQLVIH